MSSPDRTFLHRTKLLANKFLSRVGFEIVRCPNATSRNSRLVPLRIGEFELLIQANNSLWREYEQNPDYTGQLGRLAKCVFGAHRNGYMIDVGANVGDTAAMVRTVSNVPIICVEGDPAVFSLLQKNIGSMPDVTAHQCFLGERTEPLRVLTDKDGWDATLIPVEPGATGDYGNVVKLQSLDDFVVQIAPNRPCKLLKLDIEGFDLRVLRGAPKLLSQDQPAILFEFNHENLTALDEDGLPIFRYLGSLGYERLLIYDGQGRFMLPCKTSHPALLADLDDYARSVEGLFYYDICAFHSSDSELADQFESLERAHRKSVFARKRSRG